MGIKLSRAVAAISLLAFLCLAASPAVWACGVGGGKKSASKGQTADPAK